MVGRVGESRRQQDSIFRNLIGIGIGLMKDHPMLAPSSANARFEAE
jgi:hypothetical protein